MAGNHFGQAFVISTSGESHGPGYTVIIDGCPPRLPLCEADIQQALNQRRPGQNRLTTQRQESDTVQILSGVFEGLTTGTPISLFIPNTDARSQDYSHLKQAYRPGHADITYQEKYGHRDHRGGGRASARETMLWVAAGAVARKYLAVHFNTHIRACVTAIGSIQAQQIDWSSANNNACRFADPNQVAACETLIDTLREAGDSIGAKIHVEATHVPKHLGEPVFHKLDADIAHAMMSINAVKGVEIGDGFDVVQQRGSEHRDTITAEGFMTNHAGGTLGGISTGQPLRINVAFKPTSSIAQPTASTTPQGEALIVSATGRHDPCVALRAVPITEAMLALVLMDHVLRDRAQNTRHYTTHTQSMETHS